MIKNEICQRLLEIPPKNYNVVGRDKESSSGQIETNIGSLRIGITNYNRVAISISHYSKGVPIESETFKVDSTYERQLSDLVKNICDVDQEKALKRIWAHVN